MYLDLFSEETPCGFILVNDHFLYVTLQSLHFGWSLTGGSTVSYFGFILVQSVLSDLHINKMDILSAFLPL